MAELVMGKELSINHPASILSANIRCSARVLILIFHLAKTSTHALDS